jgi:hypothetical protein
VAYSYIQYTGNGTQRDFAFAFPYFNTSDIAVTVNGVAAPFTWTNSSTVKVTTAPVSGSLVLIRRTTPKSVSPVNFTDGSVLLESDLDTLANFSLYAAQEAIDTANLSITSNSTGNFEGQSKTIQNVADPVNAQDVATRGWSLTNAASALAGAISNAVDSATSAAASLASQVAAAASAAAALVSQNAAATSASTTAALLLSFRNVFLGAFASDSAAVTFASANSITLTNGISYENTTTQKVRVYNGSTWADQSADAQTQSANATAAAISAAASASTATSQATNASSSATAAAASLDNFKKAYQGAYAGDPALRYDGSALQTGDLAYNTVLSTMRVYNAGWTNVGVQFNPVSQRFSGTGSQTAYTLSASPGVAAAIIVLIGGVGQTPTTDYTVSGTTLTFTSAPPAGTNNITVINFGQAGNIAIPANASITNAMLQAGIIQPSNMVNGGAEFGMRNKLINSGFQLWQRATSSGAMNAYTTADRWYMSGTNTITSQGALNSPNNNYSLVAVSGANGAYVNPSQAIESKNVYPLRGKYVTFSYFSKVISGSFAGNVNCSLYYSNSSDAINVASGSLTPIAYNYPTPNTSGWAQVYATYLIPTDAVGLTCTMGLGLGQANGVSWAYADAQLEIGQQISLFDQRSYGVEDFLCKRYFQLLSATTYLPAFAYSTNRVLAGIPYMNIMRGTPTVNVPSSSFLFFTAGVAQTSSAISAIATLAGIVSLDVTVTATSGSAGVGGINTAITLSSEL